MRYNSFDLFIIIDGKKIYFNAKVINEVYGLPNDAKYPGQDIITKQKKELANEVLKVIAWSDLE